MKRNIWLTLSLVVIFGLLVTACGSTPTATPTSKFKVAYIYIGPPGDLGWTYEHDRGRKVMEQELGDQVEVTYIESVPEGPDAARVIRQYAQQGYNMIFATSFGYMDPMLEVAQEFPDVYF